MKKLTMPLIPLVFALTFLTSAFAQQCGGTFTPAPDLVITSPNSVAIEVAYAGDINNDSIGDMRIVWDNTVTNIHRISVHSGYNGSVIHNLSALSEYEEVGVANAVSNNPYIFGSFSSIGDTVANLGDIDNDGYDDYVMSAIGAARYNLSSPVGALQIRSGYNNFQIPAMIGSSTGYITEPASNPEFFGQSIALIKDINGDGIDDLAVAHGANGGTIHFYSLKDYSIINSVSGLNLIDGGFFKNAGDLDLDGYDELIVSYTGNGNGSGLYFMVLDTYTHAVEASFCGIPDWPSTPCTSYTIYDYAALGDVTGDGYPDFAMATITEVNSGSFSDVGKIFIFSGYDLTIHHTIPAPPNPHSYFWKFGQSILSLDDLNGDGISDILVSNLGDTTAIGGEYTGGEIRAYSVANGTYEILFTIRSPYEYGEFGSKVVRAGDRNNDGIEDFAVLTMPRYGASRVEIFTTPSVCIPSEFEAWMYPVVIDPH